MKDKENCVTFAEPEYVYTYFINYTGKSKFGDISDMDEFELDKPITEYRMLTTIADKIAEKDGWHRVIINNFILLNCKIKEVDDGLV